MVVLLDLTISATIGSNRATSNIALTLGTGNWGTLFADVEEEEEEKEEEEEGGTL
jgi:hypothetical protein